MGDLVMAARMASTAKIMKLNKANIQYSVRRARPLKPT